MGSIHDAVASDYQEVDILSRTVFPEFPKLFASFLIAVKVRTVFLNIVLA